MKHHPEGGRSRLVHETAALGVPLTSEQAERLVRFEEIIVERAVPLGLVAEADATRIRGRHTLDCLRAVLALEPSDRSAYDLGSGAGLPGVVVAIARPTLHVVLVEAHRRRVAFLELAVERLALANVSVRATRTERLREPADVCFARAFAPLLATWRVARALLRPGGRLVYFAGVGAKGGLQAPADAALRLVETPVLESAGPLVIMTRQ